jgi:hypothetical protein
MRRRDFLALAALTIVPPRKRKPSIVEQIVMIFRHRGYEIDGPTAAICWRMHGHDLDITDSEPFAPLRCPDDVFRIVIEKEKIARSYGTRTHLVRLS